MSMSMHVKPVSVGLWRALVANGLSHLTLADVVRMHSVLPMLATARWGIA